MRAQLIASPSGSQSSAADNAEILATPGGNAYEAGVYHAGVAPTSSRRAASCGSTSIPGPRWLWQSGSQPEGTAQWTEYSLEVSATIEEAFASGFEAVPVDAERLVNFRLMRQERCGAPNRSRAVRREPSSGARGPAAEHLERVAHSDGQGRERADASASTKRPRSEDPAEEQRQPIMRGSADVSQRLAWRFTRLHPGWRLPSSVNESAVGLSDLLSASELDGATEVHLHNFMVDLDWVLESCPALSSFLLSGAGMLRVFHGQIITPATQAPPCLTDGSFPPLCTAPRVEPTGRVHRGLYTGSNASALPGRFLMLCAPAAHYAGDGTPPRSRAAATASTAEARAVPGSGRLRCYQPPCERFGTHHSKAILVLRPHRLSVHVCTGNLLFSDWFNKTNAVWSRSFPRRDADGCTGCAAGGGAAGGVAAAAASAGSAGAAGVAGDFGTDLAQYYGAVKSIGASPPPHWQPNDAGQRRLWAELPVGWIREYDYALAGARLVASVPGRHIGAYVRLWGHMRLREMLAAEAGHADGSPLAGQPALQPRVNAPPSPTRRRGAGLGARAGGEADTLVLQFSSLSSVGTGVGWLQELLDSMSGGSWLGGGRGAGSSIGRGCCAAGSGNCDPAGGPLSVRVVFPTRKQVRESLEGWVAGSSLPCEAANASKLEHALEQLSSAAGTVGAGLARGSAGSATSASVTRDSAAPACLCRWDCGPISGGAAGCVRARAESMPHIKSYARLAADGRVEWAVLTSCNLSQAAWGKLEKQGTQLYIKSYELGVLITPSLRPHGCTKLVAASAPPDLRSPGPAPAGVDAAPLLVPLPFCISPTPYATDDAAWCVSEQALRRETVDRHGHTPMDFFIERRVPIGFYGPNATGRLYAEAAARARS